MKICAAYETKIFFFWSQFVFLHSNETAVVQYGTFYRKRKGKPNQNKLSSGESYKIRTGTNFFSFFNNFFSSIFLKHKSHHLAKLLGNKRKCWNKGWNEGNFCDIFDSSYRRAAVCCHPDILSCVYVCGINMRMFTVHWTFINMFSAPAL